MPGKSERVFLLTLLLFLVLPAGRVYSLLFSPAVTVEVRRGYFLMGENDFSVLHAKLISAPVVGEKGTRTGWKWGVKRFSLRGGRAFEGGEVFLSTWGEESGVLVFGEPVRFYGEWNSEEKRIVSSALSLGLLAYDDDLAPGEVDLWVSEYALRTAEDGGPWWFFPGDVGKTSLFVPEKKFRARIERVIHVSFRNLSLPGFVSLLPPEEAKGWKEESGCELLLCANPIFLVRRGIEWKVEGAIKGVRKGGFD